MRLKGEHLIVTGGSMGIGEAVVIDGAQEGAKVSFFDIDVARGKALADRLNGEGFQVHFEEADVSKFDPFKAAFDKCVAKFGPVTVACSNAGRNSYADRVEYTEDEWHDFFSLDLKSSWYVAKLCLPEMRKAKKGSIVLISSIHGRMTFPNYFPYAAAKHGLIGLAKNLAVDEGKHGIRFNTVSPGFTLTPLLKSWLDSEPPSRAEAAMAAQPLGRMGEPSEIAKVVNFVLSSEASFMNGADLMVDGGLHSRFAS